MGKRAELSIVLPTYNEKDNLQAIVKEILNEFKNNSINGEIIIVDDNSPDGTGKIADRICRKNSKVRVIHRIGRKGLSSAAMEGFELSNAKFVGLMDSDRSHPTGKIGEMFRLVKSDKAELVIGSRYVRGGKIELGWYRNILSYIATSLARPLTNIKDPLTGFFIMKRSLLYKKKLYFKGFRTLLEILMVVRPEKVVEVPITFISRKKGKSKAGINEIFQYLSNLIRYYWRRLNDN